MSGAGFPNARPRRLRRTPAAAMLLWQSTALAAVLAVRPPVRETVASPGGTRIALQEPAVRRWAVGELLAFSADGSVATVEAGRYLVTVTGTPGPEDFAIGASFMQLPEGLSLEDALAEEGSGEEIPAFFYESTFAGGVAALVPAGQTSATAIIDLAPGAGQWVLLDPSFARPPAPFEVTGELPAAISTTAQRTVYRGNLAGSSVRVGEVYRDAVRRCARTAAIWRSSTRDDTDFARSIQAVFAMSTLTQLSGASRP